MNLLQNFSLIGSKIKEKSQELLKSAEQTYSKTKVGITETLTTQQILYRQNHPSQIDDFLTQVAPRLFTMPFPEPGVLPKYAKLLNGSFGGIG